MNRIRALREDRDLRQIDVSSVTGIDQKTLSNYETGKTNPDSFAIIKLADFFDVSTDYLLGRSNNKKQSVDFLISKVEKLQAELEEIKKDIKRL
ncbi:MAG: helix-turn-helix domain-containing protein [Acutalibacteraceae bacterium]